MQACALFAVRSSEGSISYRNVRRITGTPIAFPTRYEIGLVLATALLRIVDQRWL
jgi:hypothetical protein